MKNISLLAYGPMITCISVIEHIHNFDDAIRNMFSLLKPKGYLLLTFPYNEESYVKNVYELPGSSYGQQASFITQLSSFSGNLGKSTHV